MQISDHLSLFSVDDLRTLAERRGFLAPEAALKGRQMLVRSLSAALSRHEGVYSAISGLNRAEVEVLRQVLHAGRSPGLTAIASALGVEPAYVREVLDSLRLWGLLFPEGDWEHLEIPPQTRVALHYLPAHAANSPAIDLSPPVLQPVDAPCQARPGSVGGDIAEFLARMARTRHKLTQGGKINRRDLKTMESGLSVTTPGYATFISFLVSALGLLESSHDDPVLRVRPQSEVWLAQPERTRTSLALSAWVAMRGYAENAVVDPAEVEYLPMGLTMQRARTAQTVGTLPPDRTFPLAAFQAQLAWAAPFSFQQPYQIRDLPLVVARLLRSLYWLGLVAVDDAEKPRHFRLTPLGAHVVRPGGTDAPPLVPEEGRFFLQPNAEAFAPPNLSPLTLFHLRRITGEKKGGPLGVYPVTPDSLRRALDAGVSSENVIAFLERFSRTGLPANVRALVETAGRQHGRIRLVPTQYVLVTDEAALLEELRQLKTIEPLIGTPLTDRAATVSEQHLQLLLRQLRQRGYAPLNEVEVGHVPPFPDDPDAAPPPMAAQRGFNVGEVLSGAWTELEDPGEAAAPEAGEPVYGQEAILAMLTQAEECGFDVEIEYRGLTTGETTIRTVRPVLVNGARVEAYCLLRQDERVFNIDRITWARFTGGVFPDE